jgi:hypothetical protein
VTHNAVQGQRAAGRQGFRRAEEAARRPAYRHLLGPVKRVERLAQNSSGWLSDVFRRNDHRMTMGEDPIRGKEE